MLVATLLVPIANAYAAPPGDATPLSAPAGGASTAPCNEYSPLVNPTYANLTVNDSGFANQNNIIDANLSNAATWGYLIGGSAWIEVKDNDATGGNVFPAGSYAGFKVADGNLGISTTAKVATYLGGTKQEEETVSSFIDLGGGSYKVGLVTTKPFDRIRFSYSAFGVAGSVSVYYAEVLKPCAGPQPACNLYTNLVRPTYGAMVEASRSGISLGSVSNIENVVDSDTNNYATISLNVGVLASASISVASRGDVFPAGYFAGFEISNGSLIGLELLGRSKVQTYLNGVLQQTVSANNLFIGAPLLQGSGRIVVGFKTNLAFNEIRYTIEQPVGVNLGSTQVYNAVVKRFCAGPDLTCNVQTLLNEPEFPVIIDGTHTGLSGVACVGCSVAGTENVISPLTTDYATITLVAGLGTVGSIAVTDGITTYPAGTFAGFNIDNPDLIDANLLSGLTVKTYRNGVLQETSSAGTLLSVSSSLLNGLGKQTVGFITAQPFDTVQLQVTNLLGVLNITRVYNAVLTRFCAGPDLACNTPTSMTVPAYPVVIDGTKTGISGGACVGCSVNNVNNVINTNITDYANIVMLVGVAGQASIAVQDALTDYPAGTFAGFEIEHPKLIDVGVLNSITVRTYLNGVQQESKTGTAQLVSANTSLLTDDGRRIVGFAASQPFDTVRISFNAFAGVDLGAIKVYRAVFQRACAVDLACNQTYWLVNPTFPVVINSGRTGLTGVACVGCSVQSAPSVITSSQSDYATVTMLAGVLSQGSVSVQDGITTYPAGSTVGFAIQDMNTLLQVDLFETITIKTYLDGALRESKSGGALLDLAALINWIGIGPGRYNIGFKTTMTFDEVQISVGSLASALNIVRVYAAYVDTRGAQGGICEGTPTDLSVTKTASVNRIIRGVPFTYTVAVFNAGPNVGQNVLITDAIPAVLNINGTPTISCSQGSSASVNVSGHNLSASIPTLKVNETCTMLISVTRP